VADDSNFAVGATMIGHYGAAEAGVTFAETTFAGAWNVQGPLRERAFRDRVSELFPISLPEAPNTTARNDGCTALWLGPASWLVIESHVSTASDFETRRDALNAAGGALFDGSASRVGWTMAGPHAATVLAKACPLDFHPRVFGEAACAQSVFGQVNALYYRRAAAPVFTMLVARSLARDVWRALCLSAAPYGYDVLPQRRF
jgi:sarcosine oxidase subunit gamma